ncbi:hypothetical protein J5N97_024996 [Dioscorea zingiberensis]|uniref:Nucleoside phosphorylase domain-containing protein n=1 Tax=Dioscorea zingiberensis TaxID=325984 RepID=A0A9D5C7Y1_9LILI|nr:hypothetical protein J5N97_024996 [Dioscorea zingiberensis]
MPTALRRAEEEDISKGQRMQMREEEEEKQRFDSVGTISASLVTYASIQALKPDLIINAGTAGRFKAKGACVGDVYFVSDVSFHDRRIPIPVFDLYGIGTRQTFSTPNLVKELNLKITTTNCDFAC